MSFLIPFAETKQQKIVITFHKFLRFKNNILATQYFDISGSSWYKKQREKKFHFEKNLKFIEKVKISSIKMSREWREKK